MLLARAVLPTMRGRHGRRSLIRAGDPDPGRAAAAQAVPSVPGLTSNLAPSKPAASVQWDRRAVPNGIAGFGLRWLPHLDHVGDAASTVGRSVRASVQPAGWGSGASRMGAAVAGHAPPPDRGTT
jgi:hypothetical protein